MELWERVENFDWQNFENIRIIVTPFGFIPIRQIPIEVQRAEVRNVRQELNFLVNQIKWGYIIFIASLPMSFKNVKLKIKVRTGFPFHFFQNLEENECNINCSGLHHL
jgi:hypothetical protein